MGTLSTFYVGFGLKMFPMGSFINLMRLIVLDCERFLITELKMQPMGKCDEWLAIGFSY